MPFGQSSAELARARLKLKYLQGATEPIACSLAKLITEA